jgi:hypothetical protein
MFSGRTWKCRMWMPQFGWLDMRSMFSGRTWRTWKCRAGGRARDFWLGAAPYKFVGGTLASAAACYSTYMPYVVYSTCNNISVIRFVLQYSLRFGLPYPNHHKYEFSYFACNIILVNIFSLQYVLWFGLPYPNHHKYEFSYFACNIILVNIFSLQYVLWFGLPYPNHHKYELLMGFLVWTPASKCWHLTTLSNMCSILSLFLCLWKSQNTRKVSI